jgi:hypothetical protein
METRWLPASLCAWMIGLAGTLDARQRARFVQLCTGLAFARGRRTVAGWLRACAAGRDYKRYYYLLGSVGRKATAIAAVRLRIVLHRLPPAGFDRGLMWLETKHYSGSDREPPPIDLRPELIPSPRCIAQRPQAQHHRRPILRPLHPRAT